MSLLRPIRLPLLCAGRSSWFGCPGVKAWQLHFARALSDAATYAAYQRDPLEEVNRKNVQLRLLLKVTPWPRLQDFKLQEAVYTLPHSGRKQLVEMSVVEASKLQYLAGFFDGDGHVGCEANLSSPYLHVSQSFDKPAILMLFCEVFGGSIFVESHGLGLQKPVLAWRVSGSMARRGAHLLANYSSGKRKQLQLAAAWPQGKSCREGAKAQLQKLKKYDSAVPRACTWEYCAGLFDADGHIQQKAGTTALGLHVFQKFDTMLDSVRAFWASALNVVPRICKEGTRPCFRLSMYGTGSCKRGLQEMLQAGLLCKAEQAELAIGLRSENAAEVRARLGQMTGNQQFGKRLDEAGLLRAHRIVALRRQALYWKDKGKLHHVEARLEEIERLKGQHKLLNARHENEQLLQYHQMLVAMRKKGCMPTRVEFAHGWAE